jgi:hypothetical protein
VVWIVNDGREEAGDRRLPLMRHPGVEGMRTSGELQVAEARWHDFGFAPERLDGICTAETPAAVGAFHARDGLPVSGLLQEAHGDDGRLTEIYSPAPSLFA